MSPTSQFNTEQIFSNTSMLTFSSLDNFDIAVVLKPVCKRKSFLSCLYQSAFSTAFYSILPYCHLLPLFLLKVQYSRYFLYHSTEVRIVQSRCQNFKFMLYKLAVQICHFRDYERSRQADDFIISNIDVLKCGTRNHSAFHLNKLEFPQTVIQK